MSTYGFVITVDTDRPGGEVNDLVVHVVEDLAMLVSLGQVRTSVRLMSGLGATIRVIDYDHDAASAPVVEPTTRAAVDGSVSNG